MELASPIKSLSQDLVYQKNKGKCVKAVLETGLSYCAEWILNCAQEMGD